MEFFYLSFVGISFLIYTIFVVVEFSDEEKLSWGWRIPLVIVLGSIFWPISAILVWYRITTKPLK